jgi:hypothetical protein
VVVLGQQYAEPRIGYPRSVPEWLRQTRFWVTGSGLASSPLAGGAQDQEPAQ